MSETDPQSLSSITVHYDVNEDRILVAINAGSADASGYWLTRRLALNFIEAANPYLERISPVAGKTPLELRGELAVMEREIALASTQSAISQTPRTALDSVIAAADLAIELNISAEQTMLHMRFCGRRGGETTVHCKRVELQRIVHIVEQEAAKADWREKTAVTSLPTKAMEANRRAN